MTEVNDETASIAYKRHFLMVACAGFASMASMRLCDTMLPELARTFNVPLSSTAGTISMFAIAYGVLQLLYGPLADRFGKQRVIHLTVAASAIINFGIAFSPDLPVLVILRFVAGAAAAGIVPLSMAYIGDSVPYSRRQHELAKLLPFTIMGMIFGQWAGGLFSDTIGWRTGFVVLAVLFAAVALLMLRSNFASASTVSQKTQANYIAQLLQVLRTPWARRILIAALIEGCLGHGALAFIPVHLYQHFGLSMTMAGAIVVLYGLGGVGYAVFAPALVTRLGERGMAVCGSCLMALGFALLAFSESWIWSMPACAIAGFGFYLIHNTLQTNATQMVPHARGTAVSLFACSLFLGQSIGVSLIAMLISDGQTSVAFVPSIVILPLLGIWLAWSIKHRRRAQHSS